MLVLCATGCDVVMVETASRGIEVPRLYPCLGVTIMTGAVDTREPMVFSSHRSSALDLMVCRSGLWPILAMVVSSLVWSTILMFRSFVLVKFFRDNATINRWFDSLPSKRCVPGHDA